MGDRHDRRGWVVLAQVGAALILAGLGAGVAGLLAPSSSWLARAMGAAVGAVTAVAATAWWDRARQRREAKRAAVRTRDGVLDTLRADLPSKGSVFDVLLATSTEAAPFRGRKDDLAWLDRWWDETNQPVALVTGPAGTGKTRLVTQFALDRPGPWVSGWLSGGRGADAVAAIRACGDPALVLVDDADQRPDLAAFLASLTANRDAETSVRVILICRGTSLASRLAANLDDRSRGMLDGVGELQLGPFGGADDRARWFSEAVRAYARARQVPPPDLPAHLTGHVTDPAEPILTLHAQALLAVLDSEGSRPMKPRAEGPPFDRVAAALFAHEQHRWEESAKQPEFGLTDLTPPVQAQAIAALILARPTDQAQAVGVLRHIHELANKGLSERRANIARWTAYLYPGDPPWPIQLKPDLLAEWFAVTQAIQTPELGGLLRALNPTQEAALLVLLAHASDNVPQAVQLFADIVAGDTIRLAGAGVAAALTAPTDRRPLDGALASVIGQATWPAEALDRVEDQLTDRLPQTWAAVAEARVKITRAVGEADDVATALDSLSVRMAVLGRNKQALAAAEESVSLWRALARDNPANKPSLARSLDGLGIRLTALGRIQEALAATKKSVSLWRALARDDHTYEPGLVGSLDSLGARMAVLGRDKEALAASEESVNLWRTLAPDEPTVQPGLAKALDNLALRLDRLGRNKEALVVAEESVSLWRALAPDTSVAKTGLAASLDSLGIRLSALGRLQQARAAAEESVSLWRALALDNLADQPRFAAALANLGVWLSELGSQHESLAATEEAVGRYRALARAAEPVDAQLAVALGSLGSRLAAVGRNREALAAAEESVNLWRALARDHRSVQPDLAGALNDLGNRLAVLGRKKEALAAAEEAVSLLWPLRQVTRDATPTLAVALGNLELHLSAMGRTEEALAAAEESVKLWRVLARRNPGKYQETYNRRLAQLRRDLDLHGHVSASIGMHLTDGGIGRDKPQHTLPTLKPARKVN